VALTETLHLGRTWPSPLTLGFLPYGRVWPSHSG